MYDVASIPGKAVKGFFLFATSSRLASGGVTPCSAVVSEVHADNFTLKMETGWTSCHNITRDHNPEDQERKMYLT